MWTGQKGWGLLNPLTKGMRAAKSIDQDSVPKPNFQRDLTSLIEWGGACKWPLLSPQHKTMKGYHDYFHRSIMSAWWIWPQKIPSQNKVDQVFSLGITMVRIWLSKLDL
jgi:hypothetical protein